MAKSKANERLGQTFVNKQGSKYFIKEYYGTHDVIVKFCDGYKAEVHTTYANCKKGNVKNPYDRTVFGIGYLGEGDFKTNVNGQLTREYNLWKRMLDRCYSGNYPTYAYVVVCERWLCYAHFLEDLPLIEGYEYWFNNPNQRIALDKDIKQQGVENKVYSLETVKFVSDSENIKEMHERKGSTVVESF